MNPHRFGRAWAVTVALGLSVAALVSVVWPLATYTLTLATFGLAHVVAELRYVDLRFGRGLGDALARTMVVVLLGVVVTRSATMAGVIGRPINLVIELGLGLSLVALVLPSLFRRSRWTGGIGLVVAGLLAFAIVLEPAAGLLTIAVLHNFTPVGFIAERTSGPQRRRALSACLVVFVAIPLVIASGAPWRVLASAGWVAPEVSPLGYGPLQEAMKAYLPVAALDPLRALHLFCACVFLQCAHYIAVLLVLPRSLPASAQGRMRWPSLRWWPWILAATMLALVPFAFDFAAARRGYGIFAAVHAWIEVPILLLALVGIQSNRSRP
ncbi:MAG: hypothetical protein AAF799_27775 [Myxococcota bacterium]